MKIYFDMDGVMADWNGQWSKHFPDINLDEHERAMITKLKEVPDFWTEIPFIKCIMPLWEYCHERYDMGILTSPLDLDYDRCIAQKHIFLDRHLGDYEFSRHFYFHHNKCLLATPDSLLIDDKESNVEQFREKGGMAILHEPFNTARTFDILKHEFGL